VTARSVPKVRSSALHESSSDDESGRVGPWQGRTAGTRGYALLFDTAAIVRRMKSSRS